MTLGSIVMKDNDESADDSRPPGAEESFGDKNSQDEPRQHDEIRLLLKRKLKAVHQEIIAPPGE